MPIERRQVVTRYDGRGGAHVSLRGDFDIANHELGDELSEAVFHGARRVRVDARHVTFIDCSTLSTLVGATGMVRSLGGWLVVAHPSYVVRRLIDLAGVIPPELMVEQFHIHRPADGR